ncbi:DUF2283 domain-containing protein [archaeon]|jgi:uncharacterized protein YuzE|nr:DUF2283 domain-containing protein [archaeon]MBT4417340.1 DUF2283 domain-containing protein [archaeon]
MISYDKENDIFAIHKGFASDEKFKGNIDVGDLILDVSTKERIVGIEILNASVFLKEFGVSKEILEGFIDVKFNVVTKGNTISIGIILKTKDVEKPIKIAVPLRKHI